MKHETVCKYGKLEITPTDFNHIYVEVKQPFTVRCVEYGQATFHLYCWRDNQFHLGTEYTEQKRTPFPSEELPRLSTPYDRNHSAYIKRADRFLNRRVDDDPSPSTRDIIVAEVVGAVNAWAKDNTKTMILAQQAHLKKLHRDAVKANDEVLEALRVTIAARNATFKQYTDFNTIHNLENLED